MSLSRHFDEQPEILMFTIGDGNLNIDNSVEVPGRKPRHLKLRGIIYLGGYHFTARLINLNGNVWFHDGRTSRDTCEAQGQLASFDSSRLSACGSRKAVLAVYSRA
jgi:hypothetical protein